MTEVAHSLVSPADKSMFYVQSLQTAVSVPRVVSPSLLFVGLKGGSKRVETAPRLRLLLWSVMFSAPVHLHNLNIHPAHCHRYY